MPVERDASNGMDKVVLRSPEVRGLAPACRRDSRWQHNCACCRTADTPTAVRRARVPRPSRRTPQGATAEVYLHGAHVVSWRDPSGKVRGGCLSRMHVWLE
jgi:hypothetical protein